MDKVFKLQPIFKDNLWGGRKLIEKYHKKCDLVLCAESWELATHRNGTCKYEDISFKEILKQHPEYLGKYANNEGELPILIKFIDANKPLSIQVHPDDDYAKKHEDSIGKTEFWYVIESDNGSLLCGFNNQTNIDEIKDKIQDKSIEELLNKYSVKQADCFMIYPGTCHALGSGCLVVEIQRSSDITYRMYDYDRKDANGNKRQLHIEKSLEVINCSKYVNESVCESIEKNDDYEINKISDCEYFKVYELSVLQNYICNVSINSFESYIALSGQGKINDVDLKPLDVVFVPSGSKVKIEGNIKLLKVEV